MEQRFRTATFNAQTGIGTTRGYWHYLFTAWKYRLPHGSQPVALAGALFKAEQLDVLTVCEIEGPSRRTKGIDQVSLLAAHAGLPHTLFFPAFVIEDKVNQGNAVCSRYPVWSVANHLLPGIGEPRHLGEAVLTLGEVDVRLFVTHLSLQRKLREPQIAAITDILGQCDVPTILAGDFNISEEAEFELLLGSNLQKSLSVGTFPAWKPVKALDHLLFSRHFTIERSGIVAAPRVSDHVPLVADVKLTP